MPSTMPCLKESTGGFVRAEKILRALLGQLEWPQQPRILEIGVGPGHNLLEIYPSDARLEGAKPDVALARLAAARCPAPV